MKKITHRSFGLVALAASLGAGQAFAHTSIQGAGTEATTTYHNVVIGHGCTKTVENVDTKIPVTSQSVVFPYGAGSAVKVAVVDKKATKKSEAVTHDEALTDLSTILDTANLAGKFKLIQSKDVFTAQDVTLEGANVVGFVGKNGNLQTNLTGLIPFRAAGVNFKADSCVSRLLVKVAVADICDATQFPPTPESANLWIPEATTSFAADLDGIGSPATLTINRTTKLPKKDAAGRKCNGGWDATITPSKAEVEAKMPIPGYWSAAQ